MRGYQYDSDASHAQKLVFSTVLDFKEEGAPTERLELLGRAIIRGEASSVLSEHLGIKLQMLDPLTYGQRSVIVAERVAEVARQRDRRTEMVGMMMGNDNYSDYGKKDLQKLWHPNYLKEAQETAERKTHSWYKSSLHNRVGWLVDKYMTGHVNYQARWLHDDHKMITQGLDMGESKRKAIDPDGFDSPYEWGFDDDELEAYRDYKGTKLRFLDCVMNALEIALSKVRQGDPIDGMGFVHLIGLANFDYLEIPLKGWDQEEEGVVEIWNPDDPSAITKEGKGGKWYWADCRFLEV